MMARSVNFVWNYFCQIDKEASDRYRAGLTIKRPSGFDLCRLARGVSADLGLHSDVIDAIAAKFADARNVIFPKTPRFRSFKRNLDWVPVSNFLRPAKLEGSRLQFRKRFYHLWLSRKIPTGSTPKSWNFSCDSRGRWFVNIQVEIKPEEVRQGRSVGIDLGLKTLATLSDGTKIESPKYFRQAETELAKWQRLGKKARVSALHAKIKNKRKDFLHKVSTELVRNFAQIVVGDVSPSKLMKTRMAKSIGDSGWSMLREMLRYKAIKHGVSFSVVNERNTSLTCSSCLSRSGPKGYRGLGVRDWNCEVCGATHDRDVNSAILILGLKHQAPFVEIPVL